MSKPGVFLTWRGFYLALVFFVAGLAILGLVSVALYRGGP